VAPAGDGSRSQPVTATAALEAIRWGLATGYLRVREPRPLLCVPVDDSDSDSDSESEGEGESEGESGSDCRTIMKVKMKSTKVRRSGMDHDSTKQTAALNAGLETTVGAGSARRLFQGLSRPIRRACEHVEREVLHSCSPAAATMVRAVTARADGYKRIGAVQREVMRDSAAQCASNSVRRSAVSMPDDANVLVEEAVVDATLAAFSNIFVLL